MRTTTCGINFVTTIYMQLFFHTTYSMKYFIDSSFNIDTKQKSFFVIENHNIIACMIVFLEKIINSKLSENWYSWMFKSYESGCAPGIAPLFFNYSDKELNEIVSYMKNNYNISSSIYHFNVSGNPINFDYKKCFALPIHGGVKEIEIIIKDLIKKYC